jgi:hypothetical protein
MSLTKLEKKKAKAPPPPPPGEALATIAEVEAEISLNLKLVARAVGLNPSRVLTLVARINPREYPGKTLGETLAYYAKVNWLFWVDLKLIVGRENDGCQNEEAPGEWG